MLDRAGTPGSRGDGVPWVKPSFDINPLSVSVEAGLIGLSACLSAGVSPASPVAARA